MSRPSTTEEEEIGRNSSLRNPLGSAAQTCMCAKRGKPNQRYALLFRDYLSSHPPVASAYGELKRRLAPSLVRDEGYPDIKDPAVDLIYLARSSGARRLAGKPHHRTLDAAPA